jgi:hypothetical protein
MHCQSNQLGPENGCLWWRYLTPFPQSAYLRCRSGGIGFVLHNWVPAPVAGASRPWLRFPGRLPVPRGEPQIGFVWRNLPSGSTLVMTPSGVSSRRGRHVVTGTLPTSSPARYACSRRRRRNSAVVPYGLRPICHSYAGSRSKTCVRASVAVLIPPRLEWSNVCPNGATDMYVIPYSRPDFNKDIKTPGMFNIS